MLIIILLLLLCIIYRVNCDLDNFGNEEISLLVLAAADNNEDIAARNNKYAYVYNGNNRKETIVDIIPELRRIYDKQCKSNCNPPRNQIFSAVDDYFKNNLYPAALATYNKYFGNSKNPSDKINKYDLFGQLTKDTSVMPINIYDPNIDVEILYPDNDVMYNTIASYIRERTNFNPTEFTDGKQFLNKKIPTNINIDVLNKIVELCINNKGTCKSYFDGSVSNRGTNKFTSEVNFIIVKSKINNVERYHFFTARNVSNNNSNRKMAHQFTVKYISKTNSYEEDTDYNRKELFYKDIKAINNNYGKEIDGEGYIVDEGIDIIPRSGIMVNYENNDAGVYDNKGNLQNDKIQPIGKGYKIDNNNIHIYRATPNRSNYKNIIYLINNFAKINNRLKSSQIDKVLNLSKMLGIIKLYPVGLISDKSYGITAGSGHIHELKEAIELANNVQIYKNNANNQGNNNNNINLKCRVKESIKSKRKRDLKSECSCHNVRVPMVYNIKDSMTELISIINEKNIDLLNVDNIDDYFNNIENSENFDDFWNNFLDLYKENSLKFTPEERNKIVQNINELINGYKDKISNSKNTDVKVEENNISKLENVIYDITAFNWENFQEFNEIYINDYNKDSKSKYFKEKLLRVLKKALKVLNKSVRIKFNKKDSSLRIDPKSIGDSEKLDESVDNFAGEFQDSKELNEKNLKDIADDFDELQFITDYELYSNGEPSEDSELVTRFRNEVNNKIGEEENNLEVIPSENNLIIEENSGNDIVDKLKSNEVSDEIKEAILEGFENTINESKDEGLIEETSNSVDEIKEYVLTKESEINQYDTTTLEKHKHKVIKFLKLVKNLNSLINKINVKEYFSDGKVRNAKKDIGKIKLSSELTNRINEISSSSEMAVALNEIEASRNTDFEKISNLVAFAIFAAGDKDGKLIKEKDSNGNLIPISIPITINGEEKVISIKDVVPDLKNLEGKDLDDKFSELYDIALVKYSEQFENYYNEEMDIGYFNRNPEETIKQQNVMTHLLKPYNKLEDGKIQRFNIAPKDVHIHVSSDDYLDKTFKSFILGTESDDDINSIEKFNDLPENIRMQWNSDAELPEEYKSREPLYKAMALYCIKSSKCKEYFKDDTTSFNVITYDSQDNDKTVVNHSLVINDDTNKATLSAFTLNEIDNEFRLDEMHNNGEEFTYEELYILNKNGDNDNLSKIKVDDNEYTKIPGIGFLAACGYDIEKMDGTVLSPSEYGLNNDQYNDASDNEIIEKKFGVTNNGKFNMNVVKSDVFDSKVVLSHDIDESIMKEFGKKILIHRHETGTLDDEELQTLSIHSEAMLGRDLCSEEGGLVHYADDKNSQTRFINVKESMNIQNVLKDIDNDRSKCLTTNNKCSKKMQISKSFDVEGKLISALQTLKKYDSKNIKVKEDENDISVPKELCENANSLMDVIKISSQSYKEQLQNSETPITESDSETFILGISEALNGLNYRYTNSYYLGHDSIRSLTQDKLNDMAFLFADIVESHDKKFSTSNSNKISSSVKLIDFESNTDSQSKFVNDKLHEILDNVSDLFNENNQEISDIHTVDNMDINNKQYDDDRSEEINDIVENLKQITADNSDDETKEKLKNNLIEIHNKLSQLERIFDRENTQQENYVNNSEMVYKLNQVIVDQLNALYGNDEEVNKIVEQHKSTINGINKSEVKSSNVLTLDHVVGKVVVKDYILKNHESKPYVRSYFDNMKNSLLYADSDEERERFIKEIQEIKNIIDERIEQFKSYTDSPENHYEEADHLIEVINNYNSLVATELDSNVKEDDMGIKYIDINNDRVLNNRLNYIRVAKFNKAIEAIMEQNPNLFNLKKQSLKENINKKYAESYQFGEYEIFEPRTEDLQEIIKDVVKSKSDAIITITDAATNRYQLIELKQCEEMKYKLIVHESSFYRKAEDVDEINRLTKHNKLFKNLKNNSLKNLETHEETENRFKNDIAASAGLSQDIKNEPIEYVINSIDDEKMNNNKIKEKVKRLFQFKKNEVTKASGVVSAQAFDLILNHYNSFMGSTEKKLKATYNDYNDFSKKNTISNKINKFSKIHSRNIHSENPHNNPPKFSKNPGTGNHH